MLFQNYFIRYFAVCDHHLLCGECIARSACICPLRSYSALSESLVLRYMKTQQELLIIERIETFAVSNLTPYHTIPLFNDLRKRCILKTLWEKEKMLVTNPSQKKKLIFHSHLLCCLQILSIWTSLKICRLVET